MEVKHELEQDLESCGFIQLSTLDRSITEESVRAYSDSNRLKLRTAQLQDIATKAPRLFAILVLLDRGGAITECLQKRFFDEEFFDKTGKAFGKADIPDIVGVDKQALYDRQWQIPIVLPRSPHLNLPNEFIPPFLPSKERQPRHGSFGFVYKEKVASGHIENYESPEFVAWKVIRKDDKNDWEIMMREVETLRARRHEYIVPLLSSWTHQFIESERPGASLNLLFPYSSMTLDEWLNLSEPPWEWKNFDPSELKDYIYHSMKCLCSAVAYLHKEIDGLISSHHDLKPENILVFGKDWKIADFGRTHLIRLSAGSDTEGKSGLGSFTYHPPEYWNTATGKHAYVRHGRAFDIWSLGCIFVESITVAIHGWSSQMLRTFKQRRNMNTSHLIEDFPDRRGDQDDHSYFNNMNIVTDWTRQLRRSDGSSRLESVLHITDAMLSTEPYDRPLSWEIYLDLDELLNPNKTRREKENETTMHVQRPNHHRPKTEQNPLHRSAVNANETRVMCLLKAGWSDYPVDIEKLKARDEYGIVKLLIMAKLIQRIRWRHKWRSILGKLSESMVPTNSGSAGAFPKHQHRVVTSNVRSVLAAYELNESSPLSRSGASTGRATTDANLDLDEQGMTKLHHYCENGDFWKAKRVLETVFSESLQKLLTLEDSSGMLPLHYAARNGSQALVELLLESFKLNPTALLSWRDEEGRTPLHKAAQKGDVDTIRSLLQAHKNRKEYVALLDDSSMTAGALALYYGNADAKRLLASTEHRALTE